MASFQMHSTNGVASLVFTESEGALLTRDGEGEPDLLSSRQMVCSRDKDIVLSADQCRTLAAFLTAPSSKDAADAKEHAAAVADRAALLTEPKPNGDGKSR